MSQRRSGKFARAQTSRELAAASPSDSSFGKSSAHAQPGEVRGAAGVAATGQGTLISAIDEDRLAGLVRTIEGEIVPRLLMSFVVATQSGASLKTGVSVPESDDVAEFTRLLLERDRRAAGAFVQTAREGGTPLERIYIELLAPAARHLGDLSERDECDLKELTAGLNRLLSVLLDVSRIQH
jgi:hypothetical protein